MNLAHDKTLSLLGLAAKAGKITSGEFGVEKLFGSRKLKLLILAANASPSTKKTFTAKAAAVSCPVLELADRNTLGHSIGKETRTVVAVTDEGLAEAIRKAYTVSLQQTEPSSEEK